MACRIEPLDWGIRCGSGGAFSTKWGMGGEVFACRWMGDRKDFFWFFLYMCASRDV